MFIVRLLCLSVEKLEIKSIFETKAMLLIFVTKLFLFAHTLALNCPLRD